MFQKGEKIIGEEKGRWYFDEGNFMKEREFCICP